MRFLPVLAVLGSLFSSCITQPAYSSQDYAQVHQAYRELVPVWLAFRRAYYHHDKAAFLRAYAREQSICNGLVDGVDARDTIKPLTNLWTASSDEDGICNNIESVYVIWAARHCYPYDKKVQPAGYPFFGAGDYYIRAIPKYFRRPASETPPIIPTAVPPPPQPTPVPTSTTPSKHACS